jgi:lipoprotein-releasing system permease protein
MYKLLLCWRYLRTRYLAMVCIVSVMLGVATLIVVNSVMSGFSNKLRDRLHNLLSDVDIEAMSYAGFANPQEKMEQIRKDPFLGEQVEAMTPVLESFAMMQFHFRGETILRPVRVIGIDPEGRTAVGGFAKHLQCEANREHPSFEMPPEARQHYESNHLRPRLMLQGFPVPPAPGDKPPPDPPPDEPFTPVGAFVGYAIAHFRYHPPEHPEQVEEMCTLPPGEEIILTTVSGQRIDAVNARFVVCDFFKSEMSEYDSNYVFVPLDYLQKLRTMENRVSGIQLKLKDYSQAKKVEETLRQMFPVGAYQVMTWEEKQGPLLGAIAVEKGLLNVLLFLIIAVAGFGILAIFSMIVVEKTRDVGILKALGASNSGVMNIFLGYGLLLGIVGAVVGSGVGLLITFKLNEIEKTISHYTGEDIFPRDIYYFSQIPTHVDPWTIMVINLGAVAIAVIFSILPALRAATLHPVRALRYE